MNIKAETISRALMRSANVVNEQKCLLCSYAVYSAAEACFLEIHDKVKFFRGYLNPSVLNKER